MRFRSAKQRAAAPSGCRGKRPSAWCRTGCLAATALLATALLSTAAAAADKTAATGTSSRQAREEALRSIPLERIPEDVRGKVSSVLRNTSVFRRVPVQVIDCDPEFYLFMARHPEVVVNIWQVMGISKVSLARIGPNAYRGSDGAGTVGDVRLCYSNHDTQVVYAEGSYEGSMFSKPIRAQCVLVLRAGYVQETDSRHYVTNRLDTFIHIDHVGLELVAKTFNPLVTKTVDLNFRETIGFVGTVSRTAEVNARGMLKLADKLTALEPEVRDEFVRISTAVASRAAERHAAAAEAPSKFTSVKTPGKKLRR